MRTQRIAARIPRTPRAVRRISGIRVMARATSIGAATDATQYRPDPRRLPKTLAHSSSKYRTRRHRRATLGTVHVSPRSILSRESPQNRSQILLSSRHWVNHIAPILLALFYPAIPFSFAAEWTVVTPPKLRESPFRLSVVPLARKHFTGLVPARLPLLLPTLRATS